MPQVMGKPVTRRESQWSLLPELPKMAKMLASYPLLTAEVPILQRELEFFIHLQH